MIDTGIPSITGIIGLLAPGTVTVLAAKPAQGKSSFAITVARNAASAGSGVLYVSMEDSEEHLRQRMEGAVAGVDIRDADLAYSRLTDPSYAYEGPEARTAEKEHLAESVRDLQAAREEVLSWPLVVDDRTGLDTDGIEESVAVAMERLRRIHGVDLGLVIVDYLQLVKADRGSAGTRGRDLAKTLRVLAGIAAESETAFLVLSQMPRPAGRTGSTPDETSRSVPDYLSVADNVLAVHREPDSRGRGTVVVSKSGNGTLGDAPVRFDDRVSTVVSD